MGNIFVKSNILILTLLALLGPTAIAFTYNMGAFWQLPAPVLLTQHRIFASSTHNGNLGGLTGADSWCQARADSQALGGTWKAVMSDSTTNAKDRIYINGIVRNLSLDQIADNEADLWDGTIDNAVKFKENGVAAEEASVWTGTLTNGNKASLHCNNWTSASSGVDGERGGPEDSNGDWIDRGDMGCDNLRHVYCIDQ
jgi:hypothetical protein